MLLCHFKFSFKEDKLNFRFIGTLSKSGSIYLSIFHRVMDAHVRSWESKRIAESNSIDFLVFFQLPKCIRNRWNTANYEYFLYNIEAFLFTHVKIVADWPRAPLRNEALTIVN